MTLICLRLLLSMTVAASTFAVTMTLYFVASGLTAGSVMLLYCEVNAPVVAARAAARPKQKRKPVPMSHPWRLFDFTENSMLARERRGELCILRK